MKGKFTKFLGLVAAAVISLPTYAYAGMGDSGSFITTLLIGVVVIIIVFLVLREVVCWYWKINETLSVLKEIRDSLQRNGSGSSIGSGTAQRKCSQCGFLHDSPVKQCLGCKEPMDSQGFANTTKTDARKMNTRVACNDGNCIGILGPDGKCTKCGKAMTGN